MVAGRHLVQMNTYFFCTQMHSNSPPSNSTILSDTDDQY